MRLTVGSLPAAVYWRRRAIVLAVPALAIGVVWTSCSRGDASRGKSAAATAKSTSASPSPSPSGQRTLGADDDAPGGTGAASTAPPPAGGGADNVAIACADSEILVTPVPQAAAIRRGEPMDLTIKIRNISTRSCRRDLGADAQELYLQRDGVKVYSSDACDARTGNSVRSLGADIEQAFQVRWDGTATSDGCANRQVPPAGKYQLFGRLGTKISEPVAVTLT